MDFEIFAALQPIVKDIKDTLWHSFLCHWWTVIRFKQILPYIYRWRLAVEIDLNSAACLNRRFRLAPVTEINSPLSSTAETHKRDVTDGASRLGSVGSRKGSCLVCIALSHGPIYSHTPPTLLPPSTNSPSRRLSLYPCLCKHCLSNRRALSGA